MPTIPEVCLRGYFLLLAIL